MAVLPSLCAALGLWPEAAAEEPATRREAVLPMAVAAATAAGRSGTEVAGTSAGAGGSRWALVKQRLRLALPQSPATALPPVDTVDGESASSHQDTDDVRAT
jgi:hypothetical protein